LAGDKNTASGGRLGGIDGFGVTPEALEVIVRARGFREDVNDEIAVIHENPFSGVVAFDAVRQLAGLFQLFFDLVGDRVRLSWIRGGADDEEIGKRSDFAEVQNR
jgi:hypothetical protein